MVFFFFLNEWGYFSSLKKLGLKRQKKIVKFSVIVENNLIKKIKITLQRSLNIVLKKNMRVLLKPEKSSCYISHLNKISAENNDHPKIWSRLR